MPYKTDGSSHANGVKNEEHVANKFNMSCPLVLRTAYPTQSLRFVHRGGTKHKEDVDIYDGETYLSNMSVKLHQSGTFDWCNTTKPFKQQTTPLRHALSELKRQYKGNADSVAHVDRSIKDILKQGWSIFQSEDIRQFLRSLHQQNPHWIVVTTSQGHVVFSSTQIKELSVYPFDPTVTYELRTPQDAETSRQIWRIQDGIATNTHLRLRMAMNNGVHAFLGLTEQSTAKKPNKTSSLTFKLQQDEVDKLLTQVVAEQSQLLVDSGPSECNSDQGLCTQLPLFQTQP